MAVDAPRALLGRVVAAQTLAARRDGQAAMLLRRAVAAFAGDLLVLRVTERAIAALLLAARLLRIKRQMREECGRTGRQYDEKEDDSTSPRRLS